MRVMLMLSLLVGHGDDERKEGIIVERADLDESLSKRNYPDVPSSTFRHQFRPTFGIPHQIYGDISIKV
jgi:hypothetical protein